MEDNQKKQNYFNNVFSVNKPDTKSENSINFRFKIVKRRCLWSNEVNLIFKDKRKIIP